MNIRKWREGDIVIINPEGNINIDSALFIEETSRLLGLGCQKIVCDFTNVEMVDYNGLSVITIAYKNVINNSGVMKFCHIPPHIKELFRVVRLDLVFDIYDDMEDAIRSFNVSTKIDKLYLRRRFKRLELSIPVKYHLVHVTDPRASAGKIVNIGGEGIFIYSKHTFPVGNRLHCEMELGEKHESLKVEGVVIWLADRDLQPHCYPGMGVYFVDTDPQTQKKIIDYIDKNITHRSRLDTDYES